MSDRAGPIVLIVAFGVMLGFMAFLLIGPRDASGGTAAGPGTTLGSVPGDGNNPGSTTDVTGGTASTTTTGAPGSDRPTDFIPGWTVGQPWGTTVGLTMFRGNPTRTYYGTGPISDSPSRIWTYPDQAMCSESNNLGETKVWCGMGWTGQPSVFERPDGTTMVVFGAYDRALHFVDAQTGQDLLPKFPTGDIIKGSVTVDPDGFPLLYSGSRDNKLRILALDRPEATELWSLDAYAVEGIWNDDWDGNPVIIDDIMYEGGENGWFFAYQLNRGYDANGKVTVSPKLLFSMRGWNQQELDNLGNNEVSIENSIVAYEDRVYFGNSGGRIVGLDVSDIRNGNATVVFDYWAGGDADPTLVVDADGYVYASLEYEPSQMHQTELDRTKEVGQLVKLDPYTEGDPRVWGVDLRASQDSGTWSTPALHEGLLYTNTNLGSLLVVDTETGEIVWQDGTVGWHSWSSPVVVDDTLVVATCVGELRAYSLEDPTAPQRKWVIPVGEGSCLEATPAIWKGVIYIGSRDGYIRAFR